MAEAALDARDPDRHRFRPEGTALRRSLTDLWIAAALFGAAAMIGSSYVTTVIRAGGKPKFYQEEFGPAVMLACGRGFINPDAAALPDLNAFLSTERDAFSCDAVPAHPAVRPLRPIQRAFRYLMSTVAATWAVTGVSWTRLAPLYGALFGLTIVAAYALFRTAMGAVIAACAALALAISTIHLIYLPHLRDYAKAPFVIALVAGLVRLARGPVTMRRLVSGAAAFGLVLGIGVGFRNDLLILLPLFALVIGLFLPGRVFEHARIKAAALAACGVTLAVAMLPMRAIYAPGGGNSMPHVIVLGLVKPFGDALGVTNGGLYDWGYEFKDEYAHTLVSSYATRVEGAREAVPLYGPAYDRAALQYLRAIASTFPADLLVRVYASVVTVLGVPYNRTSLEPPTWIQDMRLVRAYHLRERVLRLLGAFWPFVILAALVGLTVAEPKIALLVAAVGFYLAAYPVLQFHERHYFHLEFLGWWALGFLVQQAWDAARRGSWPVVPPAAQLARAAVIWAVIAAVVVVPLVALRRYQQARVANLLAELQRRERVALSTDAVVDEGVSRVLIPEPANASAADPVESDYLVAEFGGSRCGAFKLDATFRYAATPAAYDFTRTLQLRPPPDPAETRRVFFAAYSHDRSSATMAGRFRLAFVELPASASGCLSSLSRVRDVTGLELLPDLNLPQQWERSTLHATLGGIESRQGALDQLEVYTSPDDLAVSRTLVAQPVVPITAADISRQSSTLTIHDAEWTVDGAGGIGGRGPFLYLAEIKPAHIRRGAILIARGRLHSGGLTFGLVRNATMAVQVPVVASGEFVVVIRVPEDGTYSVIVANNLPGRSLSNHATIRQLGWLPAPLT